ncbi:hypothetical protein PIB30_059213 [Stylosanthes scabra]|uniref:DUF4378 domain-containing protein n=1 Tax=Stylosanthes scabra TaxID=79078 RepID=A0ABU6QLY7_9FABA|nr:hypothetical protein [Stylosanthes scabra]
MARKVHTHKRHNEGMSSNPQHSIKLQEEAKSHNSTKGSKNYGNSNVTQELSKQSCNRGNNVPSIVARLMGLDIMPVQHHQNMDIDDDGLGKEFTNPMLLRSHPQEEELKKFKREFEAYQASRLKEDPKFNERTKSVQEIMVPCNASLKTKTIKKSRSRFDGMSLSPTQITVLKPCCNHEKEESLKTSTSIEDFLEQVKVRLLSEIQGRKSTFEKSSSVRGSENERHRSSEVTNLLHSQSARSYTSEIELKGQSSPEFISRGTRRLERLRNFVNSENLNDDAMMILERSFSAPLSGKYCRIPIGDHIWEKLDEDLERMLPFDANKKKQKKDRFGIKEKVSNLKQKFGLRGKVFAKRIHSMVETQNSNEDGFMVRDIRSGPTVLMKHWRSHDNFTEVPPSPASFCSSVNEELWCQNEFLSPISTPGLSSVDDSIMPQVYGYISYDLNELSKQLSQLEFDNSKKLETKSEFSDYELNWLLDPTESYIKDLLVASGLYFGSWDKYLLRVREDTLTNPIENSIFEEVEESRVKENIDNKLDHKILLDLLNEALSIVLGQPLTMSRFRRNLNNLCIIQKIPPCGKELLKLVWDIIHVSLCPPKSNTCSCSFISLVKQDFGSISLYGLMNDEINVLEMEMACLISDDLVEELIKDMIDNFFQM